MSMKLPSALRSLLTLAVPGALLTGCYTQLASRRYQAGNYPPEAYAAGAVPDSATAGDSAQAVGDSPTPTERAKAPTVIVNNYYDPHPAYRGYAHWEWDYPLISFGYYSSRYDRYHRPWWWDDHRYHRRHHPHYGHGHHHPSTPVAAPDGPYKSPKRLYNPEPNYRPVNKGRRSEEPRQQSQSAPTYTAPAAPAAPVVYSQPAPEPPSPAPAAKSGGSDEGQKDSGAKESKPDNEYRSLKKGKRR